MGDPGSALPPGVFVFTRRADVRAQPWTPNGGVFRNLRSNARNARHFAWAREPSVPSRKVDEQEDRLGAQRANGRRANATIAHARCSASAGMSLGRSPNSGTTLRRRVLAKEEGAHRARKVRWQRATPRMPTVLSTPTGQEATMHLSLASLFSIAPLLAACGASFPPPTQRLADAESAERSATELGANRVPAAQLSVKLAQDQIAQAKRAMADGDNARAESLLVRAKADAELGIAQARESGAKLEGQKAATDSAAQKETNVGQGAVK